jgi:hypothetical protein
MEMINQNHTKQGGELSRDLSARITATPAPLLKQTIQKAILQYQEY